MVYTDAIFQNDNSNSITNCSHAKVISNQLLIFHFEKASNYKLTDQTKVYEDVRRPRPTSCLSHVTALVEIVLSASTTKYNYI